MLHPVIWALFANQSVVFSQEASKLYFSSNLLNYILLNPLMTVVTGLQSPHINEESTLKLCDISPFFMFNSHHQERRGTGHWSPGALTVASTWQPPCWGRLVYIFVGG